MATIRTDGWAGYSRLGELGYTHEVIRQEAKLGDDLLPRCHLVASLLKRWLLGMHQGAVSRSILCITSTSLRFVQSTNIQVPWKAFYRLVQQAAAVDPVPSGQ